MTVEACPNCSLPILPNASEFHRQSGTVCSCGSYQQPKLPGLQPGKQSNRIVVPEEDVEENIRALYRADPQNLLVTTVHLKWRPCPSCGTLVEPDWQYGAKRGVPDTIQLSDLWPPYMGALVELKGTDTKLSVEQKHLARRRRVAVVRGATATAENARILAYLERLLEPCRASYYRDGRWPEVDEI